MTLTPEQRTRLRAVAEKATPGPWFWWGRRVTTITAEIAAGPLGAPWRDGAHIAAADPTTVIALLDEVEAWKLLACEAGACLEALRAGDVAERHAPEVWAWIVSATDAVRAALAAHPSPPVGGDAGEVG